MDEHFDSYRQSEQTSVTEREQYDKEMLAEDDDTQLTSAQENAYNDIYASIRSGFRAGLSINDVTKALNEALPWKIN